MGKIKIELDKRGLESLLMSSEVENLVEGAAKDFVADAGEGYEYAIVNSTGKKDGAKRKKALIYPATKEAERDNFDNETLEKLIRKKR